MLAVFGTSCGGGIGAQWAWVLSGGCADVVAAVRGTDGAGELCSSTISAISKMFSALRMSRGAGGRAAVDACAAGGPGSGTISSSSSRSINSTAAEPVLFNFDEDAGALVDEACKGAMRFCVDGDV